MLLTVCAEAEYEGAVLGEYFDVVVVEIRDHNVAVRVRRHVVRSRELGTLRSPRTKLCEHLHREYGLYMDKCAIVESPFPRQDVG